MKKSLKYLLIAVTMVVAFSGCTTKAETPAPTEATMEETTTDTTTDTVSGTVKIVGSTTVQPVTQAVADAFKAVAPDIKVEIQGVGSSAGVKAAADGTADIGTSSRELKEEEKAGVTETVIAKDGIAIVVHPNNPVSNLTTEQIKGIFEGTIKNWNEVGGSDANIVVITREEGSGTRDAFTEIAKIDEMAPLALVSDGNGAVKANLASKENAIAYISLGIVDESVKPVQVNGVEATVEDILNGSYPIQRPLLAITKGDLTPATKAYLDYILSPEGQAIVAEHYIQ